MSNKVIVAGSRDITDFDAVSNAIEKSGFQIREIVSGAADGVDSLGEEWAENHAIDTAIFEADWDTHGKSAGPIRNKQMAQYADAAVIVWDGESVGTRSMLEKALYNRLDVHVEPIKYDGFVPNDLTEKELLRRFPEIKKIDDVWIRAELIEAMLSAYPDYNWSTSSSRHHHPPDERQEMGQWLHVKRVYSVYEGIARDFEHQNKLSAREIELGKAAVFLHDMFKYGIPPKKYDSAYGNHDTLAAEYVRQYTDFPEQVARACDTHNGGWGNDTIPSTPLEQAVHMADYIASRDHSNHGVYEPVTELKDMSDMLTEIEE